MRRLLLGLDLGLRQWCIGGKQPWFFADDEQGRDGLRQHLEAKGRWGIDLVLKGGQADIRLEPKPPLPARRIQGYILTRLALHWPQAPLCCGQALSSSDKILLSRLAWPEPLEWLQSQLPSHSSTLAAVYNYNDLWVACLAGHGALPLHCLVFILEGDCLLQLWVADRSIRHQREVQVAPHVGGLDWRRELGRWRDYVQSQGFGSAAALASVFVVPPAHMPECSASVAALGLGAASFPEAEQAFLLEQGRGGILGGMLGRLQTLGKLPQYASTSVRQPYRRQRLRFGLEWACGGLAACCLLLSLGFYRGESHCRARAEVLLLQQQREGAPSPSPAAGVGLGALQGLQAAQQSHRLPQRNFVGDWSALLQVLKEFPALSLQEIRWQSAVGSRIEIVLHGDFFSQSPGELEAELSRLAGRLKARGQVRLEKGNLAVEGEELSLGFGLTWLPGAKP